MRTAVARLLLILGGGLTALALTPGTAHADCGQVTYQTPSSAQQDPCGSAAMAGIITAAGVAAALLTAVAVGMYASGALSASAFNTLMNALTHTTPAPPQTAASSQPAPTDTTAVARPEDVQLALFQAAGTESGTITRPTRIPADAAPFDQTAADRVPRYGTKGVKTTGVLVLSDGRILPSQDSGINGPAQRIPKPRPGMDGNLVTHVESHAVASMREHGAREATLYINKEPCRYPGPRPGDEWGCAFALRYMLRPDEKLTVYGPNGYVEVFRGRTR